MFECNISHHRSVAVLCMLYKIRCKPVHPLNGALPRPYVPERVTRGALVAHRYKYAPPRCRTLQYSRTFIPFSVSLLNDLANLYSMVCYWRVSRAGPMLLYWRVYTICLSLALPTFFNNHNNNNLVLRCHFFAWPCVL